VGAGILLGVIARRMIKVFITLVAAFLLLLLALQFLGIVTVNWDALIAGIQSAFQYVQEWAMKLAQGSVDTDASGNILATLLGIFAGFYLGGKV